MDERLKFGARLLEGEKMAGLCREFGISRKTGYKILTRYRAIGLEGLTDRSRRPYRHAGAEAFIEDRGSLTRRGDRLHGWPYRNRTFSIDAGAWLAVRGNGIAADGIYTRQPRLS